MIIDRRTLACLALLYPLAGCAPDPCKPSATAADRADPPALHTPRWAFEPWISKDISDTDDTRAFVGGFQSRGIPVGVVVLDSPWETNYTTFVPNPVRYHDFQALSSDLHAMSVRLVLWTTQMINVSSMDLEMGGDTYVGPSPNFAMANQCTFEVDDGNKYVWWKGVGVGLDFFNPYATAWWHRQQDGVLPFIDGWKLDFGESYMVETEVQTSQGNVTHQAYSEAYYRDFLAYGTAARGPEFTTLVRGWDESYGFKGRFYARPEHAPLVWAGDNRRDYVGLADALNTMFTSARAGYQVVGSDIGGYLDLDDKTLVPVPFDQAVFARWIAVGALSPFMELHGRANLAPWTVPDRPDETVAIYKYWATLHHELVPFLFSGAEEARAGGVPLYDPQGDPAAWAGDFRYVLGGAFLVAPVLEATGIRDVALPAGARWYDWWAPAADALDGGSTVAQYDASDRQRIPLFVKQGAIVPMRSSVQVWPAPAQTSVPLHEEDGGTTTIGAIDDGSALRVTFSRVAADTTLIVRADRPVSSALVDGAPAAGFAYDPATRSVSLPVSAAATGHQVEIR